jgi:hypothetical protein
MAIGAGPRLFGLKVWWRCLSKSLRYKILILVAGIHVQFLQYWNRSKLKRLKLSSYISPRLNATLTKISGQKRQSGNIYMQNFMTEVLTVTEWDQFRFSILNGLNIVKMVHVFQWLKLSSYIARLNATLTKISGPIATIWIYLDAKFHDSSINSFWMGSIRLSIYKMKLPVSMNLSRSSTFWRGNWLWGVKMICK